MENKRERERGDKKRNANLSCIFLYLFIIHDYKATQKEMDIE